MLSVEAFTKKLKSQRSHAHDWYQFLPMSSRYTLTLMDEKGFSKAWAELSQWGTRTIPREELRKLKDKYPSDKGASTIKFRGETLETDTVENSPTTKATMS
jgi:hypothetical protein